MKNSRIVGALYRVTFFIIYAGLFSGSISFAQSIRVPETDTANILPKWAMGGFSRPFQINPIISPRNSLFKDPISGKMTAWESNDTFNPAATIYHGKVIVLYRAEDKSGKGIGFRTSRLGFASSSDGYNFLRKNSPVFYPDQDAQKQFEWPGGCEDPRIAKTAEGKYVIFYTEWNRKIPRLGVATSMDLVHWKKYGPIFAKAYSGKFLNNPHKSASILTRLVGGQQLIMKINQKYWMYWGEHHVYGATSTDLINWSPVLNRDSTLKELMSPRAGYFDSDLTECGPPALWTKSGIILFYNGKNKGDQNRDFRFNPNAYCAGQALFDSENPEQYTSRLDIPFLRPRESFEKSGQYQNGTVFIEGMVYFHENWFLYYGCADSKVSVAVFDPQHPGAPDPIKD